jgi:hypothetical protein
MGGMQGIAVKTQGLSAFKEWAVSVNALGEGKQVMLFRKGGIKEKNDQFEVEHPHFFLYPTYEHQDKASLKPSCAADLEKALAEKPELGEVELRYWAKVVQAVPMTSMEPVWRQDPNHIWSQDCIRARWEFQSHKPLWLLILRVFRLASPLKLEVKEDYTGCRSWIDLQEKVENLEAGPVLDDAAFEALASKVRALL